MAGIKVDLHGTYNRAKSLIKKIKKVEIIPGKCNGQMPHIKPLYHRCFCILSFKNRP